MTLHNTKETLKKAGLGSAIGITGIIIIVIFIRVGIMVKDIYFPPQITPPSQKFGFIPPITFPESVTDVNFTYDLQTTTGKLPTDLPDRLSIFPVNQPLPNFLNLERVKEKANALDFTNQDRALVQEIQLSNPYYEWNEQKGYYRKIIFNINSFDFKMTSDYLQSLQVLSGRFISDEISAIKTARTFLESAGLVAEDLDFEKTSTNNNAQKFVTFPQLFSITPTAKGNVLGKTTSLSKTQVIRVNFYQKDVEYEMFTGRDTEKKPNITIKLPILYPNPPFSTMSFWIASGQSEAMITQAFFTHQKPDLEDATATYKLKTPEQAYKELEEGKAYIASFEDNNYNILIKNIFLAYYLGETPQIYLMPIYVFEGSNNFFAYVSAITEDQLVK